MSADQASNTTELTYRTQILPRMPGWMDPEDAELFSALCDAQSQFGMGGDLLEIGCYLGKSSILLGYARKPDEQLTVCDLFESTTGDAANDRENQNYYPGLARDAFERNFQKFHPVAPRVIQGPSTDLGDLLSEVSFRFVHIDGSHLFEVVREDIALSRRLAVPGGLVVLDDISAPHTPGVTAAAWAAVANDGLTPLVITNNKMYATWEPDKALHLDRLETIIHRGGLSHARYEYKDTAILYVAASDHRSSARKLADRARASLGQLAGRLPARQRAL